MNIKDIMNDILRKKEYYITLYDNYIYIYNYVDIQMYTDKSIKIQFNTFNLLLFGNNLKIIKFIDHEMLIKGDIIKIEKEIK